MIRREILEAISDLNFWGKEQETGVWRNKYIKSLELLLEANNFAVSIIGVRRAGKTFISKQLLKRAIESGMKKEQTLYVNFEEPAFKPFLSSADFLNDIHDSYRYVLNKEQPALFVFDEIQNVSNWESWVRMMMERREKVKFVLTGSSAKLSSAELATKLTGRTLTMKVYPLSFGEFLKFKGFEVPVGAVPPKKRDLLALFREYLEFGGFPAVVSTESKELKLGILKELFDGIVSRDIAERHNIRRIEPLRSLAVLAIQNSSSQVSIPKFAGIFQNATKTNLSPTLISTYLDYFSEAFLTSQIPVFSAKIREQMLHPKKIYCIDNGMINAVSMRFSDNLGRLLENLVFVELLRRRVNAPETDVYYWRSKDREVDFILKEGLKVKAAIQVCWNLGEKKTKEREVGNLLMALEEFDLSSGLVITENFEHEESRDGKTITYLPAWRWLLSG